MRRPSFIVGTVAAATVLSALLVPTAAQAVDADQSQVVSGTPTAWTPQVLDGQVSAIAAVGGDIVIGGSFTQVQNAGGGTTYNRTYIAAFDATTGLVDTAFDPTLTVLAPGDVPTAVTSLATNGANVVLGGSFATVNGVAQRGVAQLTLTGARVAGFEGHIDGTNSLVQSLAVRGGDLFVGGRFTKVMGVSRSALAVLSTTTGALSSFNVPVTGSLDTTHSPAAATTVGALDVTPDGSTLVIGGNFTSVGGLARTQLAVIDVATAKATGWQTTRMAAPCSDPNVVTYVRQISVAPDGTYFALADGGGPILGTLCDSASRWELGTAHNVSGQQPTWVDSTGGDTLYSVATTGAAVYVGGHQRWMNNYQGSNSAGPGAVDRKMVAALDPATGLPLSWNPAATRGGSGIFDLLATPSGLWVGSDNTGAFGAGHLRLAFFPVAGGTPVPGIQPSTLPRTLYTTTGSDGLDKRLFSTTSIGATAPVTTPGGVAWSTVRGAFMLSGQVYYGTPDGALHKAAFDGTTVGSSSTVPTWWDLSAAGVTSFTYGNGRLYYVTGDGKLYYRWFSNESDIVGAEPITVAATGYADAGEMFVANGSLYVAHGADHKLYKVALSSAGAPTGSAVAVSGPGIDANTWTDKAAFLDSAAIKPFTRLYGSDRGATAIAVSQDEFAAGSAGAVVLARADAFPDGLAGAPLAYRTHAPLLLTAPNALDTRVAAEIKRVLPAGGTVYELGGIGSISAAVDTSVKNLGYTTVRLAGSSREATSVAIANQILALPGGATKALVVTGLEFPDALGAGAAAAAGDGVVLLSTGVTMSSVVGDFLTAHPGLQVWGVGGKGAAAAAPFITSPSRSIIGLDRTETATLLASAFFPSPTDAVLVNAVNFPDGLSGGPYAAAKGGPVLLTMPSPLAPKVAAYLTAHAATITGGHVLGGPAMVSDATMGAAATAIS